MTTAIYMSSKTDATVQAELQTPSFLAMVQANTNKKVQDSDFVLETKAQLISDISNGLKTGNLNAGGNSFDHILFKFSASEDAQAISNEIIKFYSQPDYIVVKNQGGGRVQNKDVKGQRETLFDLHIAQDGTAHLHILKSHFSINGSHINPATTLKDSYVLKTEQHLLNEHLEKALGTANVIGSFTSNGSPNSTYTNPKASPQTKSVVNQAVQAPNIQAFNTILQTANNASVAPNLVSNTIASIDKELAEITEKSNVLFEMRKLAEGIQLVEKNNTILEHNNKILTEENEKLETEKTALIEEYNEKISILVETQKDEVDEFNRKEEKYLVDIAGLTDKVNTLAEDNTEKKKEIDNLFSNYEQSLKEIAEKDEQVIDLNSEVSNLNDVIQAKDKQINIQITQVERLEKALSTSEETNKAIADSNKQLLERVQAIEQQLKDEKEQSAKKLAEQQKQFDDRLKALEESNKKLKEQNDIILKENTVFKELTEMAIAKYKQATTIIKSLGAKLNSPADKKTVANAVKQATEYEKAVKQVDTEKKDIEEKMAAVRAMFAKAKQSPKDDDNNDTQSTNKVKPK